VQIPEQRPGSRLVFLEEPGIERGFGRKVLRESILATLAHHRLCDRVAKGFV